MRGLKQFGVLTCELYFLWINLVCHLGLTAFNCIAREMNPRILQMTMDLYCHVLGETIEKEMGVM